MWKMKLSNKTWLCDAIKPKPILGGTDLNFSRLSDYLNNLNISLMLVDRFLKRFDYFSRLEE